MVPLVECRSFELHRQYIFSKFSTETVHNEQFKTVYFKNADYVARTYIFLKNSVFYTIVHLSKDLIKWLFVLFRVIVYQIVSPSVHNADLFVADLGPLWEKEVVWVGWRILKRRFWYWRGLQFLENWPSLHTRQSKASANHVNCGENAEGWVEL